MSSSLQCVYECPCRNGFKYVSKQTYKKHFESQRHYLFEKNKNEINIRKELQDLQIEYQKVKRECKIWKQKYLEISLKFESDTQLFI